LGVTAVAQQVVARQAGAGGSAQHRVHDQRHRRPFAQAVQPTRDDAQLLDATQQAGLDHCRRQVAGQRGQLGVQALGGHGQHGLHRHTVLRRQRGGHGAEVHAHCVRRALVGRQSSAAAAVEPGNAPDGGFRHEMRKGLPPTGVLATAMSCLAITPAS
jgi:hypothetical protein